MDSNAPLGYVEVDRAPLDVFVIKDDGKIGAPHLTVFMDPLTKALILSVITFPKDTSEDEP
jgi:hypothetical protein